MFVDCNEMITDRLWVGAYVSPEHLSQLRLMGITTIFSLQSDEDLSYYGISEKRIRQTFATAGIQIRRVPIPDFDREALASSLPHVVEQLAEALETDGARIYLHCTAGINRGPTVAAAYLIRSRRIPAREAYEYVISRRNCSPYLNLLEEYEVSLKK